jgi:hypothetical protein
MMARRSTRSDFRAVGRRRRRTSRKRDRTGSGFVRNKAKLVELTGTAQHIAKFIARRGAMSNPVQDHWKTFVDECLDQGKAPVEDVFLPALRRLIPPRTPKQGPSVLARKDGAAPRPSKPDGSPRRAPDRPSLPG